MTVATAEVLGRGAMSFPVAARLVHTNPAKLRRWMREGLTPASYERGDAQSDILSFLDLVSLEVVRRLREAGVSLQRIRHLEAELRNVVRARRPFATERFWTDGVEVWMTIDKSGDLVEMTGRRRGQHAWKAVVSSFASEIEYEAQEAVRWRPAKGVVIDPAIHFGEPVLSGTRIAVATIQKNLEVGSPEEVAHWYGLTLEQVAAAQAFLS
jgi:uncharacterized protein (DUF433 family)